MLHPIEQSLIDAVWEDDFEAVSKLFDRYGDALDANFFDEHGDTPLSIATEFEIVRILLINGADPDIKDGYDKNALHAAIDDRCLDRVKLLLSYGADVNIRTIDGKNMMQYALNRNEHDIVRLIQTRMKKSIQKAHFEKAAKKSADQTRKRQQNIDQLKRTVPCHPGPRKRPPSKG